MSRQPSIPGQNALGVTVERTWSWTAGTSFRESNSSRSPFKEAKYELPLPYLHCEVLRHHITTQSTKVRVTACEQRLWVETASLRQPSGGIEAEPVTTKPLAQQGHPRIRQMYGTRDTCSLRSTPCRNSWKAKATRSTSSIRFRKTSLTRSAASTCTSTLPAAILTHVKPSSEHGQSRSGELADPQNIELTKSALAARCLNEVGRRLRESRSPASKKRRRRSTTRPPAARHRERMTLLVTTETRTSTPTQRPAPNQEPSFLTGAKIRGQSPIAGQQDPYNPIFENSNAGDPYGGMLNGPFGDALSRPGMVDLDISATEAQTGRLMFGVGVNSNAGVVGSFVLRKTTSTSSHPNVMARPRRWHRVSRQAANASAWKRTSQYVSRYSGSWQTNFWTLITASAYRRLLLSRFHSDWNEERVGGRISLEQAAQQMVVTDDRPATGKRHDFQSHG